MFLSPSIVLEQYVNYTTIKKNSSCAVEPGNEAIPYLLQLVLLPLLRRIVQQDVRLPSGNHQPAGVEGDALWKNFLKE